VRSAPAGRPAVEIAHLRKGYDAVAAGKTTTVECAIGRAQVGIPAAQHVAADRRGNRPGAGGRTCG